MNQLIRLVGIGFTCGYTLLVTILLHDRVPALLTLAPENIGAIVAAILSPLAVFWLILGFFYQAAALVRIGEVLREHSNELRRAVDQQSELISVSRQQAEAELAVVRFEHERQKEAARPHFVFNGVTCANGSDSGTYSSRVRNIGNSATEIRFSFDPVPQLCSLNSVFAWSRGEEQAIHWRYGKEPARSPLMLTISYTDAFGVPGTQQFEVVRVAGSAEGRIEIQPAKPKPAADTMDQVSSGITP
jgi:hypothetical protein